LQSVSDESSVTNEIKDHVLELMKMNETDANNALVTNAPDPNQNGALNDEESQDDIDDEDDFFAGIAGIEPVVAAGTSGTNLDIIADTCANELKRYVAIDILRVKVVGGVYNDPLLWWKQHQAMFPILARLARFYLAVQATSAPSERIFSVASRLIANRRTRLDPSIAGKALYVSENWDWLEEKINILEAVNENNIELDE
jgi:hypothetical protein